MAKGAFADQVLKVVRSKKPKKFGDKAFIASVWQVGFASEMPLGEFKRQLVVEHQQGRLELSRADLVPAMDQVLVERSETAHLNATWHLIRPTAPAPVVAKPLPSSRATLKQSTQFHKAVAALTAENKPGALLSVKEVRARAKLPKAVFDALALGLAAKKLLNLHYHDFPTSLSAAERAELIVDPKGTYYVGMALRRIESPTLATEVDTAILRAAKVLTQGRQEAVRIARLRERLPAVDADTFDRALTRLHTDGKIVLYRDDNRMTADDRGAYFVGGEPRHLLYLKG